MYIVTGLGRCGTSIFTKYLGECGYGLGMNINWHKEARAGMELSTAYSITREMRNAYCKAGKPIDLDFEYRGPYWKCTYRKAIQSVFEDEKQVNQKGVPCQVFKDPRLTWNPALIEAWWTVRQDFKLIICHRDIKAVYGSRKALPPQYDDPKRLELDEYKVDFADFITKVLQLEIPHMFLFYPHFLLQARKTVRKLKEFGLEKANLEKLREIVDKDLLNENE